MLLEHEGRADLRVKAFCVPTASIVPWRFAAFTRLPSGVSLPAWPNTDRRSKIAHYAGYFERGIKKSRLRSRRVCPARIENARNETRRAHGIGHAFAAAWGRAIHFMWRAIPARTGPVPHPVIPMHLNSTLDRRRLRVHFKIAKGFQMVDQRADQRFRRRRARSRRSRRRPRANPG